ncbi:MULTISPECIES: hypothetical protein [Dietzia]|uniref:hypothetical protein n=1 Tax=Dietzia TaxID=37914 RepID=UPI000A4B2BB1|nr:MULTISPECIES: hypothetical protein [Dietzia]MCT1638738.1 hypothetical protein [Dietzia cinnamea]MCT1711702.1 hypothetical protein [Dietzia cinnamea]MCT1884281.1 hypothetical protein [Dietzia cinnamea]
MTFPEFGSLAGVSGVLGFLNDFLGAFGDLFSGLDYFTGGDFQEALAGGFLQ